MAKILIFGLQDFASLAHFYLKHDSEHEVIAFSVTQEYLPGNRSFEGLPVVPFEEVERIYLPSDHAFFAPMSHRRMNTVRKSIYDQVKAKGYTLISYVSSRATVFPGTRIGELFPQIAEWTVEANPAHASAIIASSLKIILFSLSRRSATT